MMEELMPHWFNKLPSHIRLFISGFVLLHLVGLAIIALMHFTSKSKPDFQAKIK
jgi:hypothetical protein